MIITRIINQTGGSYFPKKYNFRMLEYSFQQQIHDNKIKNYQNKIDRKVPT